MLLKQRALGLAQRPAGRLGLAPRGLRASLVARAVEPERKSVALSTGEETDDGESLAGDYCSLDPTGKRVKAKRRWGRWQAAGGAGLAGRG